MKKILTVAAALLTVTYAGAQNQFDRAKQVQLNTITTAVPFLQISPDSRAGAMGDAGVSSLPDVNSIHWNPSKLAFLEEDFGLGLSYSPWLRSIVPDMSLSYLSFFKKINTNSTIGGSLRYFSLGSITFTDVDGNVLREFKPAEFAIDAAYALKLSERLSTGVSLRYVNSNLTGGSVVQGAATKAGNSVAFDASVFYRSKRFKMGEKNAYVNLGANISNIGNKMNYSTSTQPDFIPSMLRFGPTLQLDLDEYNTVNLMLDFSKLLVPTPPVYQRDSANAIMYDADGQPMILEGKNPNVSPAQGVIQSFNDAPGGFKEELREFNVSFGAEYLYNKQIAVRGGYFYEHPSKGNRQYITMGAGLKYQVLNIDLSYLIPTTQNNPLANTLRLTLRFTVNKKSDTPAAVEDNG
ncbi:MAG: type IX secretion system outer membrane channel protein PorV [Bacteroidota bacterium]